MDYPTLLTAQLTDVFRIGFLAALIYTAERTRAQTGTLGPLLVGIVLIAVIIAMAMPLAEAPIFQSIISGIVANAIITAILWLIWSAIRKRG